MGVELDSELVRRFPRPLVIVDGELRIRAFSRKALPVLGVAERAGEDLAAQVSSALEAQAELGDRLALASARLSRRGEEEQFLWQEGSRNFIVSVAVLEESEPLFWVMWEDDTVHVRSEQVLLRARSYLEQLLDELPLGITVLSDQLRITAINRRQLSFLRHMGRTVGLVDAIGAELPELLLDEPGRSWHELCRRVRATGERAEAGPASHSQDQEQLVLAVSALPLRDESRHGVGVILVCQDVTRQARLERELVRAEKLATVGQMVITINHEINNPLSIISNNAQMLRLMYPDLDAGIVAKVAKIEEQVKRIVTVTERLRRMDEVATNEYIASGPEMIDVWGTREEQEGNQ